MSASKNESAQPVDEVSIAAGGSQAQQVDAAGVEGAQKEKESVNSNSEKQPPVENMPNVAPPNETRMTIPESMSDFKDWLEGIKMVARLPGGMPVEFRRKLWLGLAERYLKRRGVDWEIEQIKWFSEKTRADDEELGIQIVKDLHRTGHSLLSGPNGALNQAKLKRILMGFTRWNPEVGYCQGFNMLGAIILQVMDKNEVDSIKVMIFLIEGLLPNGYFCGSLMGLQVDMAVFRELLGNKLPKLARHLQKLQYSTNEPSVEPPLINVFTMQWFLTLFCNCLPMICVLRIWDLIMIEGSDVLLRTALALWKLMEGRILREVRTADDFYCKMETLSAELLDDRLIDSNVLVQMISDLGPVKDLQKLRQKHLTASYQDQKQLKMIYSKVQGESEKLAVANAWQSNRTRRGSHSQPQQREPSDREKIAIDITILKKQYDKLKERQKQAHIILTSAVTKQHHHQQKQQQAPANVNKLLAGKHAIIAKGGRRAPPKGAIPPARKAQKSPKVHPSPSTKPPTVAVAEETLLWRNTDEATRRKNSLTWKEINAESSRKRSDSSSYSENSDTESSTSTSLCDDEAIPSLDSTPVKKKKRAKEAKRDDKEPTAVVAHLSEIKSCPEIALECLAEEETHEVQEKKESGSSKFHLQLSPEYAGISSISQLSPLPDISTYFTAISPIKSPCNYFEFPDFSSFTLDSSGSGGEKYEVNEQGVTNEFFERVTSSSVFSMLPPHGAYDMAYEMPPPPLHLINSHSDDDNNNRSSSEGKMSNDSLPERSALRHVSQKSFSMEEGTVEGDETVKINRSHSDGTIMECDDLQKIIAENSKILTKMRTFVDSSERLSIAEEEARSSGNSSECEEIAAIDHEDAGEREREAAESRKSDIAAECSAPHGEDVCGDVTVQSGKSMNGDKNSDTLATQPICSSDSTTTTSDECEPLFAETLPSCDVEAERRAVQCESQISSPKFNEISALVDRLKKEVMESESMSKVAASDSEKVAVSPPPASVTIRIESSEENRPDLEKFTATAAEKGEEKVERKIDSENANSIALPAEHLERSQQQQPPTNGHQNATTTAEEKAISNSEQKIAAEQKDSSKILEKLNFQLQRYEGVSPSRSPPPSERSNNDYKRELEALIKEREIEKSQRHRELSPSVSNHSLYDHEPRNDMRRRDVIVSFVEAEQQRVRRPFKSSPSSSLSSSPGNISSTLSSIQNTIKSLDSACQRSEIYNYKKLDKAMESIERMCESDRDWHHYKRIKTYESSPPSFKIDDILGPKSQPPTFTRYDEEVAGRKPPRTPEPDPDYIARLRFLSTEEYIAGRKSPVGLSPSRETRFSRIDRSPTSPVLSSARFLKSPTGDRGSKSAETSPSRYAGESSTTTATAIGARTRYVPSTSTSDLNSLLSYRQAPLSDSASLKYYDQLEWERSSSGGGMSSSLGSGWRKYDF